VEVVVEVEEVERVESVIEQLKKQQRHDQVNRQRWHGRGVFCFWWNEILRRLCRDQRDSSRELFV
jgi:hypothetical protein